LQYTYHGYFINALGLKKYAEVLEQVSICEMIHLKLLGETILALGAQPIYTYNPPCAFNFYSTKFVSYSTSPIHIFEDSVRAEADAIRSYKKIYSNLKNEHVKEIIYRIIEDEELHLQTFKQILCTIKG